VRRPVDAPEQATPHTLRVHALAKLGRVQDARRQILRQPHSCSRVRRQIKLASLVMVTAIRLRLPSRHPSAGAVGTLPSRRAADDRRELRHCIGQPHEHLTEVA